MRFALVLAIAWLIVACGSDKGGYDRAPDDAAFAEVKPTVDRECGRCHNGSVQPLQFSASNFKSSKAKTRVANGSMPPDRALKAADKDALLAYLNG